MIRRVFGSIAAVLLLVLAMPAVAKAHVLKIDGQIGAVLHIRPDDNPTTGEPTTYALSLTDNTDRLDISKCNCGVRVVEDGKTLDSHAMQVTGKTDSIGTYTFSKPGVYTMEFTGTPKMPGAFQSFKLDYEVRVGQANTQQIPVLLWVGMGMVMGLVLLGAYATSYDSDEITEKLHRSHQ